MLIPANGHPHFADHQYPNTRSTKNLPGSNRYVFAVIGCPFHRFPEFSHGTPSVRGLYYRNTESPWIQSFGVSAYGVLLLMIRRDIILTFTDGSLLRNWH